MRQGIYHNPEYFFSDLNLIWKNCKAYNNPTSVISIGNLSPMWKTWKESKQIERRIWGKNGNVSHEERKTRRIFRGKFGKLIQKNSAYVNLWRQKQDLRSVIYSKFSTLKAKDMKNVQ